jgi:ribosomal protein L37AE/L43A
MLIFTCPECGAYLVKDYNIENMWSCIQCRSAYQLTFTLVSTDLTTVNNHTTKGEY